MQPLSQLSRVRATSWDNAYLGRAVVSVRTRFNPCEFGLRVEVVTEWLLRFG